MPGQGPLSVVLEGEGHEKQKPPRLRQELHTERKLSLSEIKGVKDFGVEKRHRLDFSQYATRAVGPIKRLRDPVSKLETAMRQPELHFAVRLVIVGITMPVILATMLLHQRER